MGKMTLVSKNFKCQDDMVNGPPFEHALVCYTSYQEEYHDWPRYIAKSLTFYHGFPPEDEFLQHPIKDRDSQSI